MTLSATLRFETGLKEEGSLADFNHNSDKEAKELVDNAFKKIEDKKKMKDWLAEECVVVAYMVCK